MEHKEKYLYGPVPSRRLGLSLGVDIIPFKICTLDCVYCQLGPTTRKTIERKEYVPVEPILDELKKRIEKGLVADYITFSGYGEPTLNSKLGELIVGVKKITKVPVAVLTNGTLFYRPDVRADCANADLVLPSLDAGDQKTFEKINQPHPDISIDKLISGLEVFRQQFNGQIWLEVFIVDAINTNRQQLTSIKHAVNVICPDKIQLNTAVRPTADAAVKKIDSQKLQAIAEFFGPSCEVIADYPKKNYAKTGSIQNKSKSSVPSLDGVDILQSLLSMLKRRPCSLDDISSSLGIHSSHAIKYITLLIQKDLIRSEQKNGITFYKAD